jgi:hypothetical protein
MPGYHEVFSRLHYIDGTYTVPVGTETRKTSSNQLRQIPVSSLTRTKCVSTSRVGSRFLQKALYIRECLSWATVYRWPTAAQKGQVELQNLYAADTSKPVSSFKHSPYIHERGRQDLFRTLKTHLIYFLLQHIPNHIENSYCPAWILVNPSKVKTRQAMH